MNLRSRLTRVATGDQMLFIRADVFESLSGYADIPLMEDVEICKNFSSAAKLFQNLIALHRKELNNLDDRIIMCTEILSCIDFDMKGLLDRFT